ncbi:MAG: hypothetical protein WCI92_11005 [Bacteroidota bacterium]
MKTLKFFVGIVLLFLLILLSVKALGQYPSLNSDGTSAINIPKVPAESPSYACDIRNHNFVTGNIYEFDLYITRVGTIPLELADFQAGIQVSPSLINGGSITPSIVPGSSGLLTAQQPAVISFIASSNCICLAPNEPPRLLFPETQTSSTSGTMIPDGDGVRICRIRLTNSVAFGIFALAPAWSFTVDPYNTIVSAFTGPSEHKENTVITNSAGYSRSLALRVLMEGPYNAVENEMNTALHDMIPNVQPFAMDPWHYTGIESVSVVPPEVVDWVLIDLRDASMPALANPESSKAIRAFFLRRDGQIVALDGVSAPEFNFAPANNLYAVIRHRNHIAIMSSSGLSNVGSAYTYDFSLSMEQAYGGADGYKLIDTSPLQFGMVAGDCDSDGEISVLDYSRWALDFGNSLVYLPSDNDLDAEISVLDFSKWALNFGITNPISKSNSQVTYVSQVPK